VLFLPVTAASGNTADQKRQKERYTERCVVFACVILTVAVGMSGNAPQMKKSPPPQSRNAAGLALLQPLLSHGFVHRRRFAVSAAATAALERFPRMEAFRQILIFVALAESIACTDF
jgi:hypothetical protein